MGAIVTGAIVPALSGKRSWVPIELGPPTTVSGILPTEIADGARFPYTVRWHSILDFNEF